MFSSQVISLIILFFSVMAALAMPAVVSRANGDHNGIACGSPIQNSDNAVTSSTGEFQEGLGALRERTVVTPVTDTSNRIVDSCPSCDPNDLNTIVITPATDTVTSNSNSSVSGVVVQSLDSCPSCVSTRDENKNNINLISRVPQQPDNTSAIAETNVNRFEDFQDME